MKNKINIIMPCYYGNETILPAFQKLKSQTNKNFILTIVNDCSPNTACEYQDIIDEFSKYFEIRYLKTKKNSGPGVSRQLGIDYCEEEYIFFHDDDDELFDEYVIEKLWDIINNNCNYELIQGVQTIKSFDEDGNLFYSGEKHSPSLNNCLIKTKVIRDNDIRFYKPISFLDEDATFMQEIFDVVNQEKYFKTEVKIIIHYTGLNSESIMKNIDNFRGYYNQILKRCYMLKRECLLDPLNSYSIVQEIQVFKMIVPFLLRQCCLMLEKDIYFEINFERYHYIDLLTHLVQGLLICQLYEEYEEYYNLPQNVDYIKKLEENDENFELIEFDEFKKDYLTFLNEIENYLKRKAEKDF